MKKPPKSRAVKAWGVKSKDGSLLPFAGFHGDAKRECCSDEKIIRVEIRELPRRRKKS